MAKIIFVARRDGSDFRLFANSKEFGRLSNCEVNYIYEGHFSEVIARNWEGDFEVSEMLAYIRKAVEGEAVARKGEFSPEAWSAEGMRLVGVGKIIGDAALVKEGHRIVEQACSAMRCRPR